MVLLSSISVLDKVPYPTGDSEQDREPDDLRDDAKCGTNGQTDYPDKRYDCDEYHVTSPL
jgi:hypothetical protein